MDKMFSTELKKLKSMFDLSNKELRIVGGSVRDHLLGMNPKDIDLATNATPDEMQNMILPFGTHRVLTGLQHGTITFVVDGNPFEITTLRIDVETDGRHAQVQFTDSWEKDAERRDLTINAMNMDFDGKIYDYFDGQKDLKDKNIRFVGDTDKRIKEDYLRILRYFRFVARFNGNMDMETLNIINSNSQGLSQISAERIWAEMSKLFTYYGSVKAVSAMDNYTDVLNVLNLEYNNKISISNDAVSALSVMKKKDENINDFIARWKLSNVEADKLNWLLNTNVENVQVLENHLVNGVPFDWVMSHVALNRMSHLVEHLYSFSNNVPKFPVTGKDLISIGVTPGPEMGKILSNLKNKWVDSRFQETKDNLLKAIS